MPPNRILLGAGPSDVDPRVLRVLSHPPVGHLDPSFLCVMDEVREMLRVVFQTRNKLTFPLSGTGSAGMEACLANAIEHGDKVMVFVNGYFGERMCEMVNRLGGELVRVDCEWGSGFDQDEMCRLIRRHSPKVVAAVHAETSTGVLQPLDKVYEAVRDVDALLVVDCVTSLGGVPVFTDDWGWDMAYSGTQKCIGCPPGLAPITFNDRAINRVKMRKRKPTSWYYDAVLISTYWGEDRAYHHTAPINMVYALREALRLLLEEGLQKRWQRHAQNGEALVAGIEAMGLKLLVQKEFRMPCLTAVCVPEGVNEAKVRNCLLSEFNIEIGAGLGALKGRIWRIGLMGYSSQRRNVLLLLSALGAALRMEGFNADVSSAISAASEVFAKYDKL
ncbi:MAG: alanine--glyoxylate aminotransferase family protein [Armatimonadota bacterium]|nr:alanine--glyoxylate aminotransferase family protein [Armatimonadota bacterium]MCX7777128.1 alanine--glyoxylate aminotransferase family protein [Armatimonadota bacterium]MDW8025175.1 alanine--glyoxylate aminotransferase family protein [Armatimonadota bacterium]